MNAHMATSEYKAGYEAYLLGTGCPYKAGTTQHALWKEGWNDAADDADMEAADRAQPT